LEEAATAGQQLDRESHTGQVQAPENIADRLGIEPGAGVSDTEYVIRMDGVPVTWSYAYEPLAFDRWHRNRVVGRRAVRPPRHH